MSKMVEHASRELELSGQSAEDPAYAQAVIAAIAAFVSYGHSGGSAEVAIEQLHRLLLGETLSPLTSDPGEWEDQSHFSSPGKPPLWQNTRDSRAMSNDGGQTWWFVDAHNPGELTHEGLMVVTCGCCSGSGTAIAVLERSVKS